MGTWAEILVTHRDKQLQLPDDFSKWHLLPGLQVADLRRVLRKFKIYSALGRVNIHPKAMDVVSDMECRLCSCYCKLVSGYAAGPIKGSRRGW
eukprot:4970759-Pyramimonas_sp.AAC.1